MTGFPEIYLLAAMSTEQSAGTGNLARMVKAGFPSLPRQRFQLQTGLISHPRYHPEQPVLNQLPVKHKPVAKFLSAIGNVFCRILDIPL